jgi:mannosyl-oligosaccharide alpha-1,2-mannosidase
MTACFQTKIDAVSEHLHKMTKLDGLVSCFINANNGEFRPSSTVSVGASADSYYEYLIKQWIQTGKTKQWSE